MKRFLLLVFFSFSVSLGATYAQGRLVSGKVIDGDTGEGIPGVNIIEKGTNNGTVTDFSGNYQLSTSDEATLVVSFIGYSTQEVNVDARGVIDITLSVDATELSEIVVIGYGTQKKTDLTGAIGSLSGEGLDKLQVGNPSQALMGRVAGVRVESNGGGPGASTNIVIRGVSSLTTSNPLFVIDGMFTDNMDFLNPSDIKSIQILKDASAAAIYGSRAANGVVIVTTVTGSGTDGIQVDVESSIGTQSQIKKLDWLSGQEYANLRNAISDADNSPRLPGFNELLDPSVNTIIDDIAISSAPVTNLSAKVYGTSGNVNFNISANKLDQEGIVVASDFDRKTFRANVGYTKDKLQLSESFTVSRTVRRPNTIWNLSNNILPTIPFLNPDNDGGYGGANLVDHGIDGNNHVGRSLLIDRHFVNDNALGNLGVKYEILEGLNFNLNTGLQYANNLDYTFTPTYYISPNIDANRSAAELVQRKGLYINTLIEATLNYSRLFGKHSVDILAGATEQKTTNEQTNSYVSGFPSNDIRQPSAASTIVTFGGTKTVSALRSVFGRLNYNYDGKYFVSATLRRDGSSRFSEDNRYGVFPSIAGAWTISNEDFMTGGSFLTNLKLRASYGELGSQNIDDYAFIPVLNINSDAVFGSGQSRIPGVSQTVFANPNLVWETTKTSNIGVDVGLMNNKLSLTADYFNKKSEDILVSLRIPPTSGTNVAVAQNAASIENSGIEITAGYSENIGNLSFDISSNITFIKNEVLDLGKDIAPITGGSSGGFTTTRTDVGHQVASYYGYQIIGIYQSQAEIDADGNLADPNAAPGDFRYADIDGDGELTVDDQDFLGSYVPDFEYGFTIDAKYKNFDLNMIFNGVSGVEVWNNGRGKNLLSFTSGNAVRGALDYWTTTNTDASLPRVGGGANNTRPSSFYVESGDYFRLRNIQLGYTLPKSLSDKVKLRKVRFYGSVQNLFTITNYSGYYPEIGRGQDDELRVVDNNNLLFYAGVDQSAYPTARTMIFGIQIGF